MSTMDASDPAAMADLPHDTLQPNIIASVVVCWVVAAVFVALRFYTRGRILNALSWADWSILMALVFAFACSIAESFEAIYGGGVHAWDLTPENIISWGRAGWVAILFYTASFFLSKVSILLLYMAIFSLEWVRRAGQVIMVIVVVAHVYMIVAISTACIPLQAFWDKSITGAYCHAQSVWWSNTGLLMVTDFLIFLLPMPVVWSLHVAKRQKWILVGIFGLGFFVCFISIVRLFYLIPMESHPDPDFLYSTAGLDYWTMIEMNGAIVCACLITLKPLVNKFFPHFLSTTSSRSRRRSSDNNWVSPPTIGSKPSKDTLSDRIGSTGRYKPSLDAWGEKMDEEAIDVELEEASSSRHANSSELMADDRSDRMHTTRLAALSGAKLKMPHSNNPFDPAPEMLTTDGLSRHALGKPGQGGSNRVMEDSSSERTDWGPEIGEAHAR